MTNGTLVKYQSRVGGDNENKARETWHMNLFVWNILLKCKKFISWFLRQTYP